MEEGLKNFAAWPLKMMTLEKTIPLHLTKTRHDDSNSYTEPSCTL